MQCARSILSSVTCPAILYFSTLSYQWHDYWKKLLLKMRCVFWFYLQLWSEILLILRRNERDMIKNVSYSSRKIPVILVRLTILEISQQNFQKKKSWKDAEWEPSHSKRTSMMQIRVAFHNFLNEPNYGMNIDENLMNCFVDNFHPLAPQRTQRFSN